MKRFKINEVIHAALAAAALLAFLPEEAAAQAYAPVQVTISKEKVKIDGKICYSHIVLEKQTLYSISKAYNVSIDDIYRFNPSLKETGLKKNGIILIPSQEAIQETKPAEAETQAAAPVAVQVYASAPASAQTEEPAVKETPKKIKRKTHTVKWFEDLDVIAEKYGVSVESIMQLNNLEGRKLTARQKLQIPNPGEVVQPVEDVQVQIAEETEAAQATDSTAAAETPSAEEQVVVQNHNVKAGLLLPLNATGASSHRGNMDFYSGVLLAVSDLTEKGVNIELKVCDTGSNGHPAHSYISDCNFVIGPIASADLTKTLEMCAYGPYVISPLDQRAQRLAASYGNMIQAPTPHIIQYNDLIDWVKEDAQQND